MNYFKYLVLVLIITFPIKVYSQDNGLNIFNTDKNEHQLTAPYDLRNRKSYIQITRDENGPPGSFVPNSYIHVQIFQHDKDCTELDFIDTLTSNDTVIYDLENLVKNDGTPIPINLDDDSSGYVVVTTDGDGIISTSDRSGSFLKGNFRIIDNTGYEYRANMSGSDDFAPFETESILIANFNTIDSAIYSDVIGYAYEGKNSSIVTNIDNGFSFDIFVFDLDEEPLSCDRRNFACGNIMNYGINEDYMASREDNLLCPGGSLADQKGGFITFENGANLVGNPPGSDASTQDIFVGWIGINNNNGTGSMDNWFLRDFVPIPPG